MNETQIDLVQKSFAKVVPISEAAAEIFYAHLFETAPSVKSMFKGDMKEQGQKLMSTLNVVVNGLDDLSSILPAASNLAKKHVGYGVKAEDYESVGNSLIHTLQAGLGEAFDESTREAWLQAYETLSDYMIGEAYASA